MKETLKSLKINTSGISAAKNVFHSLVDKTGKLPSKSENKSIKAVDYAVD